MGGFYILRVQLFWDMLLDTCLILSQVFEHLGSEAPAIESQKCTYWKKAATIKQVLIRAKADR